MATRETGWKPEDLFPDMPGRKPPQSPPPPATEENRPASYEERVKLDLAVARLRAAIRLGRLNAAHVARITRVIEETVDQPLPPPDDQISSSEPEEDTTGGEIQDDESSPPAGLPSSQRMQALKRGLDRVIARQSVATGNQPVKRDDLSPEEEASFYQKRDGFRIRTCTGPMNWPAPPPDHVDDGRAHLGQ